MLCLKDSGICPVFRMVNKSWFTFIISVDSSYINICLIIEVIIFCKKVFSLFSWDSSGNNISVNVLI